MVFSKFLNHMKLQGYRVFLCASGAMLFFNTCNAMSYDVVDCIDLKKFAGHAIVPRPIAAAIPDDLGDDDVKLQEILQTAIFRYFSKRVDGGCSFLNVNDFLARNKRSSIKSMSDFDLRVLLSALKENEKEAKVLINIYRASLNHEIGSSAAATLFSHIMKQGHIWTVPSNVAVSKNLHYLSWASAIRVFEAGHFGSVSTNHSSFLIGEDVDALDFFRELLIAVTEAIHKNANNLTVYCCGDAVFIDICSVYIGGKPFYFTSCDPSAVVASVPENEEHHTGIDILRAFLPRRGASPSNKEKAESIRDIADYIGQVGDAIVNARSFPVLVNGLESSVEAPQTTNKVRFCISAQGKVPFIASLYPQPR